ncbi:SDR family oxidoreductase [Streptosporangium saharense]|uniref:SDR family oxidoreductase n=1 Tax=Streptosporangium saharense TaxID=1706840 RepID=UPI0034434409
MRVVIVGGTSGIGLATAELLAGEGHEVVVTGRSAERVEAALKRLGDRASGEALDARDVEATRAFFAGLGAIDHVVVTVSGRGQAAGPLRTLTREKLTSAVQDKLIPQLLTAQAALGTLSPEGSLTFVSAASARSSAPGVSGLAAVNGALESVVPGLAVELAPIRVNAVSPGVIDTGWWTGPNEEGKAGVLATAAQGSPTGRVGRPQDVASAIAFVVGNSFVTGTVLTVDGGWRLKA